MKNKTIKAQLILGLIIAIVMYILNFFGIIDIKN